MKQFLTAVAVLAMAMVFSACSMSLDTVRYLKTSDVIQTAPCVIEVMADATIPEKATKIKILEPVMFDYDEANIRADQEEIVTKISDLMEEYPDTNLVINGHASTEGTDDYNQALSQRRADAVKAALIEKGVAEDRICDTIGIGEVDIFGEILELNRRVVVLDVE